MEWRTTGNIHDWTVLSFLDVLATTGKHSWYIVSIFGWENISLNKWSQFLFDIFPKRICLFNNVYTKTERSLHDFPTSKGAFVRERCEEGPPRRIGKCKFAVKRDTTFGHMVLREISIRKAHLVYVKRNFYSSLSCYFKTMALVDETPWANLLCIKGGNCY